MSAENKSSMIKLFIKSRFVLLLTVFFFGIAILISNNIYQAQAGLTDKNIDLITIHEAYSDLVNERLFPTPLNENIKNILKENKKIKFIEHLNIQTEISKYCLGDDYSWIRNTIDNLPSRAMNMFSPSTLNYIGDISFSEATLIEEVDLANSCRPADNTTNYQL